MSFTPNICGEGKRSKNNLFGLNCQNVTQQNKKRNNYNKMK